ncbi:MAG: tetratricopeptide repeat protein [candidate division WOR-3 bacterium]|nr:MAG: tetratricopeptide repeat protein [candidate division WOR-3 bacterium]
MKRYRGKHRVSKADLKEDKFQRATEKVAEAYYRDKQRFWVIGGIVLVVVVGAVLLIQNRGGGPSSEAQLRFTEALGILTQGDPEQAVQAFQNVASAFGKDPAGIKARYYLGHIYYNSQRFEEAGREFSAFLKRDGKNPILAPAAQLGLGDVADATGNPLKAADEYKKVRQKYPESPLVFEAMMAAGRAYANAGEYDKAEVLYQELLEEEPGGEKAEKLKVQLSYVRTLRSKL